MKEHKTFCPEDGWDVQIDEDGLCIHCGATATGEAVDILYDELQQLRKLKNPKKTFCPNDGWDVGIDDEDCCLECGWLAVGEAVNKLHEARELLRKEHKSYDIPGAQSVTLKATNVQIDKHALIKTLGLDKEKK